MIFYFSGTGNSLYTAKRVADETNEKLISIAECLNKGQFEFDVHNSERIGFVFPVYFYGVPSIVVDFVKNLKINKYSKQNFSFVLFTLGGSAGNALNQFKRRLKQSKISLDSGYSVVMPDNYIIMFNLLTPESKIDGILKNADVNISKITEKIKSCEKGYFQIQKGAFPRFMTFVNYPFYKKARTTKPFYTTDNCNGCGLCEKICPSKTIKIDDKRPVWEEGRCTQCLACIHRCPKVAIQYGKKTITRGRYFNPNCGF